MFLMHSSRAVLDLLSLDKVVVITEEIHVDILLVPLVIDVVPGVIWGPIRIFIFVELILNLSQRIYFENCNPG